MHVNVRLFARLRDIAGTGELEREVPTDATVAVVWQTLVAEFQELDQYTKSISSAVNTEYSKMNTVLNEDDEVAFLPPVSGGSSLGSGVTTNYW